MKTTNRRITAPRRGVHRGGRPEKKSEVSEFDFTTLVWSPANQALHSLTRLLTAFALGQVSEGKLRILIYGARALIPFFELEVDDRINALERQIEKILRNRECDE
jgi:hypothetical protein